MNRKIKAEIILLFVASIWAGTFPIIKITLSDVPPFYFLAIRFITATIIFIVIFRKKLEFQGTQQLKAGLVLGLLLSAGFVSQTTGMLYTTASKSALITGVNIMIVPFAQFMLLKKPVGMENWTGVVAVTAGLFLLTMPMEYGVNAGDLITLACAFAWAFYIIYIDIYTREFEVYTLILIQFCIVSVISLVLAFTFEDPSSISVNAGSVLSLLYMGILATFVATSLGNMFQKYTSPIRATLLFTWEQPAAVMLSVVFLNEDLKTAQIIGGIMMITGILFSETFEYIKGAVQKKKGYIYGQNRESGR